MKQQILDRRDVEWTPGPDYQSWNPSAPGWLQMQSELGEIETLARVVEEYGPCGNDERVGKAYRRSFKDSERTGRVRWVRRVSNGVVWTVAGPPGTDRWSGPRERISSEKFDTLYRPENF
jgi:hypothetical protein